MDVHTLLAVATIWTVAAVTPGPNFFITLHTAAGRARNRAYFTVAGIITGTLIWAISGYFGISLLFAAVPLLYHVLKILGGCYLIYVGVRLFFARKHQQQRATARQSSPFGCYRLGLLTNLLNPKTAAFVTSLFAATIPAEPNIELGVACILLMSGISALWYTLVAVIFSTAKAQRIYGAQKERIEKFAGALFAGFGARLALSD